MLGAEVYLVAATVLCILGALVLGILCVVFLIRKRWRSAAIAGCAVLGLTVAGVACGVTCGGIYAAKSLRIMQPFTGEELFARTVMKDVPLSVTVLHRLDDSHPLGMDAAYYLHFRISPEDFVSHSWERSRSTAGRFWSRPRSAREPRLPAAARGRAAEARVGRAVWPAKRLRAARRDRRARAYGRAMDRAATSTTPTGPSARRSTSISIE